MAYSFDNFSPTEFEILCKDVLQRKLNIELYTFAEGPDGGIDISDAKFEPKIVIQVKRYVKTDYTKLLSSLKKEQTRINNMEFLDNYYICTSLVLSRENKVELCDLFKSKTKDISHIIDNIDLNNLLSDNTYNDIVNKHYKLWLAASNVLSQIFNKNIFFDCEILTDKIDQNKDLYVRTNIYKKALKIIEKNQLLIITGEPGIGKSTLAEMSILYLVSCGYKVIYSSVNNLENLKNISTNDDSKEVYYLDDFLGQAYLNLNSKESSTIKDYIIKLNRKNKTVILTSRITILNQACTDYGFHDFIDRFEKQTLKITADDYSKLEKAQIFLNHLWNNSLPSEYYQELKLKYKYVDIINHPNYNPRIIEFVCKKNNYSKNNPETFPYYIINCLDYPEVVWLDEYKFKLLEEDRALLSTLYSLTDLYEDYNILMKCYNKRIELLKSDTTINWFEDTIQRLSDSFIRIIVNNNSDKLVSVINPSLNDFLRVEIGKNSPEMKSIASNAVYFKQIDRLPENENKKNIILDLISSETFFNYDNTLFFNEGELVMENADFYFLKYLTKYKIWTNIKLVNHYTKRMFKGSLYNASNYLSAISSYELSIAIKDIIKEEVYLIYNIDRDRFLNNILIFMLKKIHLNDIFDIVVLLHNNKMIRPFEKSKFMEDLQIKLLNSIEATPILDIKANIYEISRDFFENLDSKLEKGLISGSKKAYNEVLRLFKFIVKSEYLDEVNIYIEKFQKYIKIKYEDLDLINIFECIDIDYDVLINDRILELKNHSDDYFEDLDNDKDDVVSVYDLFH